MGNQVLQCLRIQQRQIAGNHQPGRVSIVQLRGANPGGWSLDVAHVDDLREAAAQRVGTLVRSH